MGVKRLVDASVPVWAYDLPGCDHRLRLVLRDEQLTVMGWTPLAEGVRRTIEHFRAAVDAGRLDVERAIA